MKPFASRPVHVVLWFAALGAFIALHFLIPSYRLTRIATLALAFIVWFGFIAVTWRHRWLRRASLVVTFTAAAFLSMPGRQPPPADLLRQDYVTALARYENVPYVWGGECRRGIDCSGLIRRGLIDALLRRGLVAFDPRLLRQSFSLWWNDSSAKALGEQHLGLTIPVLSTPSLNLLDHSRLLPGDLAVTRHGAHILAYLGNHQWIQADPSADKVITLSAPSENSWFQGSMNIVRWTVLE